MFGSQPTYAEKPKYMSAGRLFTSERKYLSVKTSTPTVNTPSTKPARPWETQGIELPQTPTKGKASAGPEDRMVLRAPAGGGQAAGTAGASWHGQIFVRLNQGGGAQTVSREGSLTLRTGATRVLEVSSEDTVAMVKERIPGAERLVFGGKDLPDHATLAECGVPRDSTIDALPRCRGGAPTAADLATVRRELDLMRHLSQEMGARVARLQVCFVFAFPQLHQDLDCINPQT